MILGSIIFLPDSERVRQRIFGAYATDFLLANCDYTSIITDSEELYSRYTGDPRMPKIYLLREALSDDSIFNAACSVAADIASELKAVPVELAENKSFAFGIRAYYVTSEKDDPQLNKLRHIAGAHSCDCHDDPSDAMIRSLNNTAGTLDIFQSKNSTVLTHKIHDAIIEQHMNHGVLFIDPDNTYVDITVTIGSACTIYPNVFLEGKTSIGDNTIITPGCRLIDTTIGDNCVLQYVVANSALVADNVTIGPFVNLRPKTVINNNCKIGDFVEVKNSFVGEGSKLPHLSYIGDSNVGERVNVGCGTVFVNYDGKNKHRTVVGNDVFIGCNANLVAPITIGNDVFIAAGSTLTDDVPDGAFAIARGRQVNKLEWTPPALRAHDDNDKNSGN